MRQVLSTLAIALSCVIYVQAQSEILPTARGAEAIEQLKESGQYESLKESVKRARQAVGQATQLLAPEAVGQTEKLLSADGAAVDNFGFSVAISGDTAIVSAYLDDVGSNGDQGSAYIFTRNGSNWTQQAQLLAADGAAGDLFGRSVAISGNTAIVGAPLDNVGASAAQGSVYVFSRSGTTWTQQVQLTNGAAGDQFGRSVAISGETAIVGAFADDIGSNIDQGSAYVFARSGTTWTQQAQLIAADGAGGDSFGGSVAIVGETAIVGASLDDIGGANQGSVYVFIRSGTIWAQQAQLLAADGAGGDEFGDSVGISGDTIIIGAYLDDVGSNLNQGSAYVFTRSGTSWTQQAQLTATGGAASDNFGRGVAISGETAIVGAFQDDIGSNSNQGAAYIFARSGTTWTQQPQITAADGAAGDNFGRSVAISGNNIIVGAHFDDTGANINQGSAYVFQVLSSNWIQKTKTTSTDGAANDYFGRSVAISGDTAIVGAHFDDVGSNADQGSAYIFIRNGTSWAQQAQLLATDGTANDSFGSDVAISGDTAVVGADDPYSSTKPGSAYVFTRTGTTWTQQAKILATGGAPGDHFGSSVAISGETAIVSAEQDNVGSNTDQGSAYVFTRSGSSWTQQTQLLAADGAAFAYFGGSVAINGDTAIVSAPLAIVGGNGNQGSAYVFTRSGSSWTQQQQITAADGAVDDRFGTDVAISGETAIVSALGDDIGTINGQGSAYVFTRSGTTWTQQAKLLATGGAVNDYFGSSVSISGDTAVVGALYDDVGSKVDQGSAYVFERTGTSWTQKAQLIDSSGAADDYFGTDVAISGNTIIVGAPEDDTPTPALSDSAANSLTTAPAATNQGTISFFVNTPLAATAASASVGGRVLTTKGNGLINAIVVLTDASGISRTTRTTKSGQYHFDEVATGETFILSVNSKRYRFAARVVSVIEELTDLDFIPER